MKKLLLGMTYVICMSSLFCACKNLSNHKAESNGKAYEVYLLCSKEVWQSSLGDTLRSVLLEPVYMINQREPRLDVVQIRPELATTLIKNHTNILTVEVSPEYAEPSMTVRYDVNATPQIVVDVTGANDSIIAHYVWEHGEELRAVFEMTERDRFLAWVRKYNEKTLGETINQMFGIDISIPRGYKLRNQIGNDFIWISYELPLVSQGAFIYSYPYTGKEDFSYDSLVFKRNQYAKLIPGPSDGSYMKTSSEVEPDVTYINVEGRNWAELRGFWDVKGDFMGGPFVSYSTLDTRTNRIITIDTYLFSPKNNKRNYLRQLENFIYLIKFPDK